MMKRIFLFLLCVILLTGCASRPAASGETLAVTDDTGAVVSVPLKPKKVAVLLSSLADLWITAGGSVDITVGETVERGFADSTVILVDDGAGKSVNLEALIAAQPDFVLYACDIAGQLEVRDALLDAGIPAAGLLFLMGAGGPYRADRPLYYEQPQSGGGHYVGYGGVR